MTGDRLLRIARYLYGARIAEQVFVPLVADLQRDYGAGTASRGRLVRRWLPAVLQTFIWCMPNAFGFRMPAILFFEVCCCFIFLPLAALMLQWREIAMQAGHFGWRLVAALSFTVIPIVWRFRVAAIPEHQRRALTRSFVVLLSAIVLGFGYEQWPTRAAQVAGIFWLAFAGWRLGAPARRHSGRNFKASFLRFAMVGGCLLVANWPVALALGVDRQSLYWQQQQLLSYAMAFMTVVTLKTRFNGFTAIRP